VIINKVMGYKKLNIALSGLCLAIWLPATVIFLLMNTVIGYVLSVVFFVFPVMWGITSIVYCGFTTGDDPFQ
jgi:hypothetical protein